MIPGATQHHSTIKTKQEGVPVVFRCMGGDEVCVFVEVGSGWGVWGDGMMEDHDPRICSASFYNPNETTIHNSSMSQNMCHGLIFLLYTDAVSSYGRQCVG